MFTVRFATLLLVMTLLAGGAAARPQGQELPVLTRAEQDRLGEKLRAWLTPQRELTSIESQVRRASADRAAATAALRKRVATARKSFEDALDRAARAARAPSLLRSLADLDAIFAHAFTFEPKDGGQFTVRTTRLEREAVAVGLWLPGSYDPRMAYPAVLSLPARAADDRAWVDGRTHLTRLWGNAPLLEQAVLLAPGLPKDMVLDRATGNTLEDERREQQRVDHAFTPLSDLLAEIHLDTNRVVLECGRDNCLAALRIASHQPHRFAGVVVRDPTDLATILPDSFRNLPILFVVGRETERHADAFLARLQAAGIEHGSKRRGQGVFPFAADNPEIGVWILDRVRNPFPRQVSVLPVSNRRTTAFWVTIHRSDPIATASPVTRPQLDATADRAQNTFRITARGIQEFSLLVNDALVDMDGEIQVVVNGEPIWRGRKARSLDDLATGVLSTSDPHWLYAREIDTLGPLAVARAAVVSDGSAAGMAIRWDATPGSSGPGEGAGDGVRGGPVPSAERISLPGAPGLKADDPAEVPEPTLRVVREQPAAELPVADAPGADGSEIQVPMTVLVLVPVAVLMLLAVLAFVLRARTAP